MLVNLHKTPEYGKQPTAREGRSVVACGQGWWVLGTGYKGDVDTLGSEGRRIILAIVTVSQVEAPVSTLTHLSTLNTHTVHDASVTPQ